jgi:hypothetical protein
MSIRADIDDAITLRSEIASREKKLEPILARLIKAGLAAGTAGRHDELVDAERTGTRWLAKGSGIAVPIIFTADKLMGSFQRDSQKHKAIQTVLGMSVGILPQFYKPVHKYEARFDDGKKFRAEADRLLGKAAPAFITACVARDKDGIAQGDVRIDWDHAEPVAGSTKNL